MKKERRILNTVAENPATVLQPQGDVSFPADYNGIPYSVIVNSLLDMFGFKGGAVPQGARNSTLYRLARVLRYICDFNPAFVFNCIPDWGLSDEERMQTISSAVSSSRATELPPILKSVLDSITKPDLSTNAKRQEYLTRLNPLPQKMPFLFRYIYKRYGRNGRSAIIASLPMLGTLLGRFESKYLDGRKHRPVFMVVVAGHAGSGKGFLSDLQDLLLKPVMRDDEVGRLELEAYAREREKKKGAKQLPDKPTPCMRLLSATSSNGMLLERAKSALGQPLCIISEEIDESTRANKGGSWADKSDIFRKAFDGAIWGQDYLTYSGSVKIYMNLVFAGTYVSVRNYFANVENGLMTRFFFTEMARDMGQNIETRWDGVSKDDIKAQEIVEKLYSQGSTIELSEPDNIISFQLPCAKREAYKFNDEKIKEWEASGPDEDHRDTAIDILRRRAAVVLFRASQICYALEGYRETAVGQAMARWFANESYLNQYIMFADALNAVDKSNRALQRKQDVAAGRVARCDSLFRIHDDLPDVFSLDDFTEVLVKHGIKTDCSRVYLRRMLDRDMLMPKGNGFEKIPI